MHDAEQFWRGVGYLLIASTASAIPLVVVLVSGVGEFFW